MRFSALLPVVVVPFCFLFAQGIVIDHTCTDIDEIPQEWITAVENSIQSHYAHTSHGGQLVYGMEFIEEEYPAFNCEIGYQSLPSVAGAYCVFDGQETDTYITPELYWESPAGLNLTRDVLNNNPQIDTSMWGWCTQCDYYSTAQIQAYLDAMTTLEAEYPDVTFIYFTGNAQSTGAAGYNRYLRNNQIRSFCVANNKVLFDFADMDCWWYNPSTLQWEQNTYNYNGIDIPAEHPAYYGDEYAHTTAESCTVKGSAWWWMMAVLAGWSSTGIVQEDTGTEDLCTLSLANPVSVPFSVSVQASAPSSFSLNVFDVAGRQVADVACGTIDSGENLFIVNNKNLREGVYFLGLTYGNSYTSRRVIVVN
jgi:hypothetical protein